MVKPLTPDYTAGKEQSTTLPASNARALVQEGCSLYPGVCVTIYGLKVSPLKALPH